MTAWATIVLERLGFQRREALSLGERSRETTLRLNQAWTDKFATLQHTATSTPPRQQEVSRSASFLPPNASVP